MDEELEHDMVIMDDSTAKQGQEYCLALSTRPSTSRPTFRPTTTTTTTTTTISEKVDIAFDGNGFLRLYDNAIPFDDLSFGSLDNIELSTEFTTSKGGLIFWMGERSSSRGFFFALSSNANFHWYTVCSSILPSMIFAVSVSPDGSPVLQLDFGGGQRIKKFDSFPRVNDGSQHSLKLTLETDNVLLSLDGSIYSGQLDYGDTVYPRKNVYIGNYPGGFIAPFYGCINSFQLSAADSFGDTYVKNLNDKLIMQDSTTYGDRSCGALTKFPTTTIATVATTPINCLYKDVDFGGSGYIKLRESTIGWVKTNDRLEIKMDFRTRSSQGLLLWQGETAYDKSRIGIFGKLRFRTCLCN